MRRMLAPIAALSLFMAAPLSQAADLAKPAAAEPSAWNSNHGCFVEGSAAGTFLEDARRASGAIGLGCDTLLRGVTVGAGVRVNLVDERGWSLFARFGLMVNPSVLAYGLFVYGTPEYRLRTDGTLAIGAGIETQIRGQTVFLEGTKTVDGPDEIGLRAGLRWKF